MGSAIDIIKEFEGCSLRAYKDGGGVWTVGYGATGAKISEGTVWTREQCEADLAHRLDELRSQVQLLLGGLKLSENQMTALISLAYNIGIGALSKSSLLNLVKAKLFTKAAKAFTAWDRDNDQEVKGLLKRRLREAYIFLS